MADNVVFNPQALQENLVRLNTLLQRLRQKEAVGSADDELTLHRAVHDYGMLAEVVETFKVGYTKLQEMIAERDARIKELEAQVQWFEAAPNRQK